MAINPGKNASASTSKSPTSSLPRAATSTAPPAGRNGPIVVTFFEVDSVLLNHCVDTTRALAMEIIKNPQEFYVNIHNAEFPGGALRGQLAK